MPEITDDDVLASRARVRALLVSRVDMLWQPVQVALVKDSNGEYPADPRILEFGLRLCRELAEYYNVKKPPTSVVEEEAELPGAGEDRRALIEMKLAEVEERLRS